MFKKAKLRRFFVTIVVIFLIFPNTAALASSSQFQNTEENSDLQNKDLYFIYSDSTETIPIYAEPSDKTTEILIEAPNPSKVQLLEELDSDEDKDSEEEFLLVLFESETEDSIKEFEGYVNNEFIVDEEEIDKILSDNILESDQLNASLDSDEASDEDAAEEEQDASDKDAAEEEQDASDKDAAEEEQDASDKDATEEEQDASDKDAAEEEQDASDKDAAEEEQDASDKDAAEEEQDASDKDATEEEQDASDKDAAEEEQDASDKDAAEEEQDASDKDAAEEEQDASDKDAAEEEQDASDKDAAEEEQDASAGEFLSPQITTFAMSPYLRGVALKDKTYVYQFRNTNSKKLKSYNEGTILQYRSYSANWYQATVYLNGKAHTGFIHKNHVDNLANTQQSLKGIAKDNPTRVYKSTSTSSGTWKSYSAGSLLQYRTFSTNWYQATVYVNGKQQTGYIHKNHVENAASSQTNLQGVAKNNPTRVYKSTSTSSGTWKTYSAGSLLQYKTFTSNWYQAEVIVNGKRQTGYIHKNHVENAASSQTSLQGVAKNNPTRVYKSTSTSSGTWKTYSAGSLLQYKTFTSNWYQAEIIVNGKRQTGYIHKNHVENADSKPSNLRGVAKNNTTRVYKSTSTGSATLKSYSAGSILQYRTFTSNWYQATVVINGKRQTGYIHKNHVENITSNQQTKTGYAAGSGSSMNVYASPNTSSKVLKSYTNNSSIKYKTFTTNWYQATVYVNGKAHTGYIYKDHVSSAPVGPTVTHNSVAYNYTFKHMVDRQMAGTPKSDGAGRIAATRGEVEFFSNPNNFSPADQEYFQFLVLSNPGGFSAAEINQKILIGAGTLSGQGQAFITAAKQNNINEAYLIAHAMHETGNGKSTLAQGIPVDAKGNVTRNANGQIAKTSLTKHTVYNMYGYGAVDADPINGGAKYAFDRGWFTPEAAIIGGAGSINSYISRGQDTLYKMRWNPDNPGYPQYATHVRWATGQTKRIYDIYQLVDNYEAVYEIPAFINIPNTGNVVASALNVRLGPGTNNSSVGSLTNGTQVKIVTSNTNGWYQIESGNTKGWVSATYINLNH
ncbi:SH3 domain-containing protein [Oceanobacillus sp. FSL W8-0428]|uniref:SH3 domain-containing protein n=1 Tax=Oceanobacillus sp. FSL W8-0428 TaxID=2921715 RepID=UPI0030F6F26B